MLLLALYAIGLPIIRKHTDKARSTNCLTNLKIVAQAAIMYAQDYDGRLPLTSHDWQPLLPYALNNKTAFICPEDPDKTLPFFALHPLRAGTRLNSWQPAGATILHYEAVGLTPAYRHDDRSRLSVLLRRRHNILSASYCDGHAKRCTKWQLSPDDIMRGTDPHYMR